MKFLNGSLVINPRGSLGGVTFSMNGSGNYARAKRIPIDKKTSSQRLQRGQFGSISQFWRQLTSTQIQSWKSLAASIPLYDKLGNLYYRTGFQQWKFNSANLTSVGNFALSSAPSISLNSFPVYVTFEVLFIPPGTLTPMSVESECSGTTNYIMKVFSTGVVSNGMSGGVSWKFCAIAACNGGSLLYTNIQNNYLHVFKNLPILGEQVFFKCFLIDTVGGFRSPWYNALLTV